MSAKPHAIFPDRSHDELARDAAVRALRTELIPALEMGSRALFDGQIGPRLRREAPEDWWDRHRIRDAMLESDYVRYQISTQRSVQEMMQLSALTSVERQASSLAERARQSAPRGSLTLNPDMVMPSYVEAIDIHCQPGGYAKDYHDGDVAAGAIYERTISIYLKTSGGLNDGHSRTLIGFLKERDPEMAPRRILELGCGIGNNLLPYKEAFPDAEVHGVDVGAALLRYGHARAEALGVPVHLKQAPAEDPGYDDGSFDLIVSHILAHEVPEEAWLTLNREALRLLAPGGVVAHGDVPVYSELGPYTQYAYSKETYFNNEPFWCAYRDRDPVADLERAGFPAGSVERGFADPTVTAQIEAVKAARAAGDMVEAERISRRPMGMVPRFAFVIGHKPK